MTKLIHILGSDIPHHNQTILHFFNDELAAGGTPVSQFMLVSADPQSLQAYPALTGHVFASKWQLARAVVALALRDRGCHFFFHGQFNPWLWLAITTGLLPGRRVSWHIWGGDLYETSSRWAFKLFYRLRRYGQGRLARVFATLGDLDYFRQRYPSVPGYRLYFPTRMLSGITTVSATSPRASRLTILVGNSGDPSNRHIAALDAVFRQFGAEVEVIVPMGYPAHNTAYIATVREAGEQLFPRENLQILTENIPFTDYLSLLRRCHLGYFLFERQQGIGTICLLIQAGIPCVLSRKNPFWQDMESANLPVLFEDTPLSENSLCEKQQQLLVRDHQTIPFFYPGYMSGWYQALSLATEDPA